MAEQRKEVQINKKAGQRPTRKADQPAGGARRLVSVWD